MGLAQLYQIRGRVGRSDRQGYAYITYKRDKLLSEIADKRLKAIKEFTEFGSGFKIAMRDLEIRGAGSLLGEIQHGHLEQVGYDTYCNLLDEVVREIQGEKVETEIDVQIDLDATCYIPDTYISDSSQKIEIYQDIALCKNEEDIQNVIDEMIDRFGNMPKEIENLIEIARIKILCKKLNISKVQGRRSFVLFMFEPGELSIDINELVKKYKNRIKFTQGIKPQITLTLNVTDKIFSSITQVTNPQGIMAIIEKNSEKEAIDFSQDIIVMLDDVQDPGNLGTILRTVDSIGLNQIIVSKGTADAFNPKVVRSTMGAIFRLKIIESENLAQTIKEIRKHHYKLVVTSLQTENSIYDIDFNKKIIVIGNEANGVSNEIQEMADEKAKIPMLGKTESLNASVAAGIVMYEYVRQKVSKK